jgi:exonuclease SbcC
LAGRDVVVQQLAEVVEKLHSLEKLQEQHEDTKCQREAIEVRLRTLTGEKDTLKREGEQLSQKLKLITEAHAESKGHVGCPLCGTGLTAEALERVRLSYEHDIAEKRVEYKRKQQQLEEVNAEFVAVEKRLAQEREQLKPLAVFRQREAKMQQQLHQLDQDGHEVERERSALMQTRALLNGSEYAREARRELLAVTAQVDGLGYDEEGHRAAATAVADLRSRDYDGRYHKLASAERELQTVLQYLEEDRHNLEAWKVEQERERAEVAVLQPQVEQLNDVAQALAQKQREESELARTVSDLSETRGGLRNKLLRCEALQEDKARYAGEYQTAVEEKVIYDELAVAFGKKGIQAMIIENVIPEVEQEANALLHRMTDGRMSVQFATQRDAKTVKSVIETLDINISDEIGTRPYELYSGGEAFRVNFALRIALSKLLARRAGAQLQTLVIDEGFGSQDGQGREKLVSAIRSIEGDFEKILVITHIEELKDEFPVRINVVKTVNGSRIIMGEA